MIFWKNLKNLKTSYQTKQRDSKRKTTFGFKKLNKTIDGIKAKIKIITTDLITVQSGKMIRDTSPIDEENALNKYKNNLEMVIEHLKLDDEYDRFMAEIELSEN
jgi:hypothetical protein